MSDSRTEKAADAIDIGMDTLRRLSTLFEAIENESKTSIHIQSLANIGTCMANENLNTLDCIRSGLNSKS